MDICGDQAVYIPPTECDDCEQFNARLRVIEELLSGMRKVEMSKTDVGGQTVRVMVLGEVVTGG